MSQGSPRPALLVSVRDALEAAAAVAGGADIVDAKEPLAGALGPVAPSAWRAIEAAVPPAVPVSAALGDVATPAEAAARLAGLLPAPRPAGSYVKAGFAGLRDPALVRRCLEALVAGARAGGGPRVIAVACPDAAAAGRDLPVAVILDIAAAAGAHGLLLDTADKDGPPLPEWLDDDAIRRLAGAARTRGLRLALAGRLAAAHLPLAAALGADVVGVRGAACVGGRGGRVDAVRVATLRAALEGRDYGLTSAGSCATSAAAT